MKRLGFATLTLLLPAALSAQQADPITTSLKQAGGQYAGWLTAAFDSVPESKYSFKPTEKQLTIGMVATHLENANYIICSGFSGMPWKPGAKDSLPEATRATWPKDTLMTRLRASFDFCNQAFASMNDAKLAESMEVGPPNNRRTIPKARYALIYVTDLVDHYSQMANYMRLNGMTPPSSLPRKAP
ncbi:MAG TPA: DinB family protein [Gemmatimonadaceae bacterium]|nr:DinB family protein [Gemmatimonadaceae bacterium]